MEHQAKYVTITVLENFKTETFLNQLSLFTNLQFYLQTSQAKLSFTLPSLYSGMSGEFMLMGVLASWSAHAWHSVRPPSTPAEIFQLRCLGGEGKNHSFQAILSTKGGGGVPQIFLTPNLIFLWSYPSGERERTKNAVNSGHLVSCNARKLLGPKVSHFPGDGA